MFGDTEQLPELSPEQHSEHKDSPSGVAPDAREVRIDAIKTEVEVIEVEESTDQNNDRDLQLITFDDLIEFKAADLKKIARYVGGIKLNQKKARSC